MACVGREKPRSVRETAVKRLVVRNFIFSFSFVNDLLYDSINENYDRWRSVC